MNSAKNALLVVVAAVLPLVVFELGVRIFSPQLPSIYEADSTLLYRLVPNGRKTYLHRPGNGGSSIPISINADGYRGPPLSTDSRVKRVVVYGDSFIEGEFSPDSATFVRVLERQLRAKSPTPVEVVNAGVVGYGPDQELRKMEGEIERLRPSLLILAIFADNDLGDLVRDRMFRLTPDSQLVRNEFVLDPALQAYLAREAHPAGMRRFHAVRWLLRRNSDRDRTLLIGKYPDPKRIYKEYMGWALARSADDYASFVERKSDTVRAPLGDYYDLDVAATPDVPSARYKRAVMSRLFGEFRKTADAAGIPLAVVVIPSPIDACEKYDFVVDPARYPGYDRTRLSRVIASMAQERGLATLNLWSPFAAAGACSLYFRFGNNHWNGAGQAVAAGIVADSLQQWGMWR